jgi:hypothetical protein
MMRVEPSGDIRSLFLECRTSAFRRQFRGLGRSIGIDTSEAGDDLRVRSKLDDQAQAIRTITEKLFPPGALEVQSQSDPDEPVNEYWVLDVQAEGEIADVIAREREWHMEVSRAIPGDSSWLRLCVYPK